jgi:hypothetical protein
MIYGDRPYWLQYVFDGKTYQASIRNDVVKNNGEVSVLVRVGKYVNDDSNTTPRLVHIINRIISVEGGGHYDIEIIEAPTITDVGTEIEYEVSSAIGSFSNLNRQSVVKQNSIVSIYSKPTYTGGVVYDYEFIPVGGQKTDTGEFSSGDVERILQPNTDYIIRIINASSVSDGVAHTTLVWYESGE